MALQALPRSVSVRWRAAFLSVALFCIFYLAADKSHAEDLTARGYTGRRVLQADGGDGVDALAQSVSDSDTEQADTELDEEVESLCAKPSTNASEDPLFPADLFSDEQLGQGAILLHVIGVLYMFYALALVCDTFFVPSLDVIIEKFGISPDVAGATLMAAGGSAPELFTSIIGVFIAVSDVGIGTIVGSAVFNVLFVIAACAFASAKALQLTAWPLIRDTVFYSISLMLLVGFFVDNKIEWWEALILFLWYGAYVLFMKFNVQTEAAFLNVFPGLKRKEEEVTTTNVELYAGFKYNTHRPTLLELMAGKVTDQNQQPTELKNMDTESGIQGLKKKLEAGNANGQNGDGDHPKDEKDREPDEKADLVKHQEEQQEEEYKDFVVKGPQGNLLSKLVWVLTMPLMVPMWITTPDPSNPSRKKFFYLTFLISILWIMVFSYLMVWWATKIGQIVGISDAVMGLTFLAAGTSVPDLITSVLVAKQGHGDMAVSSSIGSNIFDVTVGLPVPWLLYTIVNQKPMAVSSVGMGCSIGMLFIMLLLVFLSILVFKWRMTKVMGGVMLILYAVFVVVSLGLSSCWFSCPI